VFKLAGICVALAHAYCRAYDRTEIELAILINWPYRNAFTFPRLANSFAERAVQKIPNAGMRSS